MISVTDSFKKAIKSQNRSIFGYVDMKYENNNYSTSIEQIPSVLPIFATDGILNGAKVLKKYATLENNYTLLDGSFMVWNENVIDNNGYVSLNTFNDIDDNTIIINNISTEKSSKGITVYFKENLPFDFDITITDINGDIYAEQIRNNSSMVYQFVFDDETYISQVELNILNIEFNDNRIRLAYIDFNLSDLYDGDELVKFDVTEELDLLLEDLPINTCNININNYPSSYGGNKFDPINPKGIVKYLNNNVTIEPYIGVLTTENGIEYVPMGVFYLSDWSSDADGNVSLNGKSVLEKLKAKEMVWDAGMFSDHVITTNLATMIKNTTNIDCLFPTNSMLLDNWSNIHTKMFDYLSYISPCLLYNDRPNLTTPELRKLYVNRYNNFVIDNLDNTSIDNIDRGLLVHDVKYTTNRPIKNVIADYTLTSSSVETTTQTIINTQHTLSKPIEYIWFNVDKYLVNINSFQGNVLYGSATTTLIGSNMHLIHAKIEGIVGSTVNIVCTATIANDSSSNRYSMSFVDDSIGSGDTINLNFGDCEIPNIEAIKDVFFALDKPYKVVAQTMGDPSLEIGDMVSIQTRYQDLNDGYKDFIITKQTFTYNGGLSCTLEGLGD